MSPTPLDRRTRHDGEVVDLDADQFFTEQLPELVAAHGHLAAAAIHALEPPPLAIDVDGQGWTVMTDRASVAVVPGVVDGAMVLTLDAAQFSDWAQQLRTLNALLMGGELRREGGRQRHVAMWDAIWLALLEGWPVVDADPTFVDRDGRPLDLTRCFTPDDEPADVAHFLREAGYLHLRGWLDAEAMAAVSADIDRALPAYQPDDGRSWWATLADGTERCVRLQHFVEHSPTTADLLAGQRWDHLRRTIGGDDLVQGPVEGNCIEALVKPLGVAKGISDVPWHRDCNFGRHAYRCSSTTVGIAVTPGGETTGQLRVIAGSHRLGMPSDLAYTQPYLPIVALPTETADITVHLSCTLHEAMPPLTDERKVMYTNFGLAPRPDDQPSGGRQISDLRERVHKFRTQPPSPLATRR